MFSITKKLTFAAAHRLNGVKKCENVHGHNYGVEITLGSDDLNKHDMVLNFDQFIYIEQWIDEHWDHAYLSAANTDQLNLAMFKKVFFLGGKPTAERMARCLFRAAQDIFEPTGVTVLSVTISETATCSATYSE